MKQLERKSVGVAIKAVGDDGSFEAAIATFGELDHDRDIVMPGAFGDLPVSVLPSHDSQHVSLGKTLIEERGNTAVAVGQFNLEIQAAREWHSSLKFDLANPPSIQEWSWGFRPVKFTFEERDGGQVRFLHKVDTREVSPVLRGASIGTGTLSAKSLKAHTTKTVNEPWDAPTHARRLAGDAEKSAAFALISGGRGCFLHHMIDDEGKTGAANIRACVAGIACLMGARGVTTLSEEQRQGVYKHLASHLGDAGIEAPKLGDKPGIKFIDQVQLATWDAETVLARLAQITADRPLGKEAKAAAMLMAEQHAQLMTALKGLAEGMLPADAAARAAASFLATEAARHGVC
jgi:hypothetical protein